MMRKTLSTAVAAAILVVSPGPLATRAFAQAFTRAAAVSAHGVTAPVVPVTAPNLAPTLSRTSLPGAAPTLGSAPTLALPTVMAAPAAAVRAAVPAAVAQPARAVTVEAVMPGVLAVPMAAQGLSQTAQAVAKPGASSSERGVALETLFTGGRLSSYNGVEVPQGPSAPKASGLSPSTSLRADAARSEKDGALVAEVGIGAAVLITAGAIFSPSFRNLLSRAWNALLGLIGIGVKKAETPEVMAQRIIDQLNAAKPEYNRKVQTASTMVEKLRLQIQAEKGKVAELQKSIDAILTDSDPGNDDMALGLINTRKALEGSIVKSDEQLVLAEKTLVDIKAERARFFAEREETLAKVQAGLTRAEQARIQKEMAELRGGFQVGDLKDNVDRFEEAVREKEAEAKGTQDSVESNPDEVLRKAKDEYRNREAKEELERRKKELAEKAASGSAKDGALVNYSSVVPAEQQAFIKKLGKVLHIGINLAAAAYAGLATGTLAGIAGVVALLPGAGILGSIVVGVFAEKYLKTSGATTMGAIILGGLVGLIGAGAVGYLVGYHGASIAAAVAMMAASAVTMFLENVFSPHKGEAKKDGALVTEIGIGAAVLVAAGAIFSPAFRGLLARAWNAFLGLFGIGVKKLETPEVMAQRIIDQLNAAKPEYNRKVQTASTMVEKIRLQLRDQKAKVAELQKSIDAILTDSDPANDDMALGLINTRKALDASNTASAEQLVVAEKTLAGIKEERARFFAEREETLAKVQAGLTRAEQARIQKEMAELRGGFQVGDLKDNVDRFEEAVREKEAEAKGTQDSVESNPDEVLRKAKDEYRNREAKEELERRKKELAEKGKGA